MDEIRIRSLKLLADPHKLKGSNKMIMRCDRFRQELDTKFNYNVTDNLYAHLLKIIQVNIIIDSIINNAINQVILNHNP